MIENNIHDSPYIGLQPYSVENQMYFFGRARDSRIISSNLFAASLTVLYGASGVGKSSVLQAGVVPLLHKSPRTAVVSFQRWPEHDPIKMMKIECLNSIHLAGHQNVQVDVSLAFDEFLLQATQAFHGTVLIILDQFEEYFLYHPKAEHTFDVEIARAVNRQDIDAHFIIALREDSLSMLDRFRTRIPNLLGNSLRLRHLDATSAEEAIRKPLEVFNQEHADKPQIIIEDDLVKTLIKDVQVGKFSIGQGGQGRVKEGETTDDSDIRIEAPFLQLVLNRLWVDERDQNSNILRLETLETLGGATEIVKTHLDHVMEGLPSDTQDITADIFRYLVTPSGTKIAYTVKDLEYYAKPTQPLEPILEKLAQGNIRILRRVESPTPGEPSHYEIYHDVLAPAILDWRARYENDKELNQELTKVRANAGKEIRSLLKWAALGALVDILWIIFSLLLGLISLQFFFMVIIPMGAFAFSKGLRKVTPPLLKEQVNKITRWWFGIRIPLSLVGIFISALGLSLFPGNPIVEVILIGLGAVTFFISGPIGGLYAYWRIRREENK